MEIFVLILRVLILIFEANICFAGLNCRPGTYFLDPECPPCHWGSHRLGECIECPDGCEFCPNYVCLECKQGYYYDDRMLCRRCRQECKNCTANKCIECVDGRFGDECEHECTIENCRTCSLNETLDITCVECNPNFFLQNGKCICTPNCIGPCNTYGMCLGACIDGFSGDHCETACSKNCKTCNRNIKYRCQRCEDGSYGSRCDMKCGVGCLPDKNKKDTTCAIRDGKCNHGCIDGRRGKRCNLFCSRQCVRNVCEQFNGRCVYGCIEGFEGARCSTKKVDKEVSDSPIPSTDLTTEHSEYGYTDFNTDLYTLYHRGQTLFSTVAESSEFGKNGTTEVYYHDDNLSQENVKQTKTSTNIVYIGSGISVFVLMMIIIAISIYLVNRRRRSVPSNQNAAPNTVSLDNLACSIGINPRDKQNDGHNSRDQQNDGDGDSHYDCIEDGYIARTETVDSDWDNDGYLKLESINDLRNPDQMYLTPVFSGEYATCGESSSYEKLKSESMKRNKYLDLKAVHEDDAAL
ncbi:hypothetical protein ACF0H5_023322 [Mactra antiquata]